MRYYLNYYIRYCPDTIWAMFIPDTIWAMFIPYTIRVLGMY